MATYFANKQEDDEKYDSSIVIIMVIIIVIIILLGTQSTGFTVQKLCDEYFFLHFQVWAFIKYISEFVLVILYLVLYTIIYITNNCFVYYGATSIICVAFVSEVF